MRFSTLRLRLPLLLSLLMIGTAAMAQDVYPIMMKERQFGAGGPPAVAGIAANWNTLILLPGSTTASTATDYHQGTTGGIDLVRIVLSTPHGDLTTIQSLFVQLVEKPYSGPTGDEAIAAALKDLAVAVLSGAGGAFTFEREDEGVRRFRCSAPSDGLVGLYHDHRIAVAQVKKTEAARASADVADNKTWFALIGVPQTGK